MSREKQRVRYELDIGNIRHLSDDEIKAILRAADELIAVGGRSMLAKILKGSKDKKVLEYGLDQCPVYGYYRDLTLQEITNRVDWMIKNGYFEIEYRDRLPMLIFSEMLRPKVIDVTVKDDYCLLITFDNQEKRIFNVKPYLSFKPFEELKNPVLFKTVKPAGLSIAWIHGQDICPDEL